MPPNHKKQRGRDNQKKKEAQNAAQQHAAAVVRRAQLEAELQRKFGTPAIETLIQDMAAAAPSKSSSHFTTTEKEDDCIVCYHGSSAEHFVAGSGFLKTVKAHVSLRKKYDGDGWDQLGEASHKFLNDKKYKKHMLDIEFTNFLFALGVSLYWNLTVEEKEHYRQLEQESGRRTLGERKQTPSYELDAILKLGLFIKYDVLPNMTGTGKIVDTEQVRKYNRDLESERGIINCLYRETKQACDCMKTKKVEANGMDKTDLCHGCRKVFLKDKTKKCNGCDTQVYCSEECSIAHWPVHKPYCKFVQRGKKIDEVRRRNNNEKQKTQY